MTTHPQPTEGALDRRSRQERPGAGSREARGVSAPEMLAILAPTPEEPESLRSLYLWKTGEPAPSFQPSAA